VPRLQLDAGRSIFYTEEGAGPKSVLLIHGWACDGADWAWLSADLSADHRCIALDNRGHGRSTPTPRAYSPRLFAEDAARLVEQLSLDRPIVVGHSMGTIIASVLAVERPDLVGALVLIDPVYGQDDAVLAPTLDAVRRAPHATALAAFNHFYGDRTPAWLPVWHRRRILATEPAVVRDALVGLYEGDGGVGRRAIGVDYLPRRQAPMLAIYGAGGIATAEWDRQLAHGPFDEVTTWPEHGHFLHQEDPSRFASEVRRWLRRCGAFTEGHLARRSTRPPP
jgi:pimeloyl-ACP methyl ester carboxylesterase